MKLNWKYCGMTPTKFNILLVAQLGWSLLNVTNSKTCAYIRLCWIVTIGWQSVCFHRWTGPLCTHSAAVYYRLSDFWSSSGFSSVSCQSVGLDKVVVVDGEAWSSPLVPGPSSSFPRSWFQHLRENSWL